MANILRITKIAGIMTLISLVVSIVLQGFVYYDYKKTTTETYKATEAISKIVNYSYQYQLLFYRKSINEKQHVDYKLMYQDCADNINQTLDFLANNRSFQKLE